MRLGQAEAPSIFPCASGTRYFCFLRFVCPREQNCADGQLLTPMMVEVAPSPAAISSSAMASAVLSMPAPP